MNNIVLLHVLVTSNVDVFLWLVCCALFIVIKRFNGFWRATQEPTRSILPICSWI